MRRMTVFERLSASLRKKNAGRHALWKLTQLWKSMQVDLCDSIQRLALKDRHCGYRRIGRLLQREGWVVNHKRVLRLMHEDNLLSIRRRRFVITTDSDHKWRVYPNLGRRTVVSGANQ